MVDLIVAKARVTQVKAPSLPQLELLAAILSNRLIPYIVSSYEPILNDVKVHCWSDSQIVLHWISSLKRLKPCLHRIIDATWNYVLEDGITADILSCDVTAKANLKSEILVQWP